MDRSLIVITGVCAPERRAYAQRVAAHFSRPLISAADSAPRLDAGEAMPGDRPLLGAGEFPLGPRSQPVENAQRMDRIVRDLAATGDRAVVELPRTIAPTHVLGHLEGDVELVCVVDAVHALSDLEDDRPLRPHDGWMSPLADPGSRALQAALYVEFANTVVIHGWERVSTPDLSVLMSLLSHLAPTARLRLSRGPREDLARDGSPEPVETRPGWVRMLNADFDPHMTDPTVSAYRYEQIRPFHPGRLREVLDAIEKGTFGSVLRSSGFCRLATRASTAALWEHVGSAIWFNPIATDMGEFATIGQDIAFFGIHLDAGQLKLALDGACVTDSELNAGPRHWKTFTDPLPAWNGRV